MRSAVVLPQPGGPDEDHELAVRDRRGSSVVDRDGPVGKPLRDAVELDRGHQAHSIMRLDRVVVQLDPETRAGRNREPSVLEREGLGEQAVHERRVGDRELGERRPVERRAK